MTQSTTDHTQDTPTFSNAENTTDTTRKATKENFLNNFKKYHIFLISKKINTHE
jgi:hypothetical protein